MSRRSERLALFVPDLQGGGAERVIVDLANQFAVMGYETDLVVQSANGAYRSDVDSSVTLVDLGASRLRSALVPLIRYLRRAAPRAMLSTPSDANLVSALAWASARVRGRLVVREAITASIDDAVNRGLRAKAIRMLRRRAYQSAAHVVAPSAGVANDLIGNVGIARERVSVIPNPVAMERIYRRASQEVAMPGGPTVPVVLGAGRLSPQKDFATLLQAFARVSCATNAILVILGEGDERAALRYLAESLGIADRVFMPGFVENPFAYLKRASAFVLSSRYEGLPNVLLQAIALNTPSVATDCVSGPRELLENGRWGRLVPVGGVEEMAAGIRDALAGRVLMPPRAVVEAKYGVEAIATRYLAVLLPDASSDVREAIAHERASVSASN